MRAGIDAYLLIPPELFALGGAGGGVAGRGAVY